MSQPNSVGFVVADANILIAICSKEPKLAIAQSALANYASKNWEFYAPNVIVSEVLYVLCQKVQTSAITMAVYDQAIEIFKDYMSVILPPPSGEAALIKRAKEIRDGYGCSRSSDCLYIALAEQLSKRGSTEILTFDTGITNQVTKHVPTVNVSFLPI
ncbi:MAG TPA: type II toxin-antitoxin system VapC family toxin [Blastocatellia bacterium]|nr:type II toxin-antitoxin system VapC family toxin [Blastocatellia bacterium]